MVLIVICPGSKEKVQVGDLPLDYLCRVSNCD